MTEVNTSPKDISWTADGRVVVRSPDLLRALVDGGKSEFVRTMPQQFDFPADAVTIDEHGDVVVNDPAFRDFVARELASNPTGLSEDGDEFSLNFQGGCIGNGYCPKKVETE